MSELKVRNDFDSTIIGVSWVEDQWYNIPPESGDFTITSRVEVTIAGKDGASLPPDCEACLPGNKNAVKPDCTSGRCEFRFPFGGVEDTNGGTTVSVGNNQTCT